MVSGSYEDRITEFSLAVLEGSGWYQVDYAYAEPITYGKNKGCAFLDTPCVGAGGTTTFDEFCSPLRKESCGWTQRFGGICGASRIRTSTSVPASMDYWGNNTIVTDSFSDNCPTYVKYRNQDCEDSTMLEYSPMPDDEYYGYGAKCFMASLSGPWSSMSEFGFCFNKTVIFIYIVRLNSNN